MNLATIYKMDGENRLLDEDGQQIEIGPGDRLVIPKRAWHAEGALSDRAVQIVWLRNPIPLLGWIRLLSMIRLPGSKADFDKRTDLAQQQPTSQHHWPGTERARFDTLPVRLAR